MPCYQAPSQPPSGNFPVNTTGFATEAECLEACKEGACCNGTTCTVKPQCQCDAAAGEVFKGVGTVCDEDSCPVFCYDSIASRACGPAPGGGNPNRIPDGYACDPSPCCPQARPNISPLYSRADFFGGQVETDNCQCCSEIQITPGRYVSQKSPAAASLVLTINGTQSSVVNGTYVLTNVTTSQSANFNGFSLNSRCRVFDFYGLVSTGDRPCNNASADLPEFRVSVVLDFDSQNLEVTGSDYGGENGCQFLRYQCGSACFSASLANVFGAESLLTQTLLVEAINRWLCGTEFDGVAVSGFLGNTATLGGGNGTWTLSKYQ